MLAGALLAFSFSPLLSQVKEIRLGMHVEEFLDNYPELRPPSLRFTGQLEQDSIWHGIPWKFSFSFTRGAIGAGSFRSVPFAKPELHKIKATAEAITQELDRNYQAHEIYANPKKHARLVTKPGDTTELPKSRYWICERTRINLRPVIAYTDTTPKVLLELEMYSTTRQGTGILPIDAPYYSGMPIERFAAVFPAMVKEGIGFRGPIERLENIGLIQGYWTYWFDYGKLQDYRWERSFPVMVEERPGLLDTTLITLDAMVDAYSQGLGKPDSSLTSPRGTRGTPLRYAAWALKEEQIEMYVTERSRNEGLGFFIRLKVSPIQ